jgi:tetraacyldisaccharide 4'-kinase
MPERLRKWTENVETFLLGVILEERAGTRATLVRFALYACSRAFELAVKARRFLYNVRIMRDSTLGVQVIAVGNLTVGGTGKTPVVEKFARELRDQGRNVAILSRGYRSKPTPLHVRLLNKVFLRDDTTPPRVVSDGKSLLLDSEMAGDEPTCSLRIYVTLSCWSTRTASKAGAMRSKSSAVTFSCSMMDSSIGNLGAAAGHCPH